MAYSDFTTLTKVRESFGLTIEESIAFLRQVRYIFRAETLAGQGLVVPHQSRKRYINLFTETPEVLPSSYLQTTLNENVFLQLQSIQKRRVQS